MQHFPGFWREKDMLLYIVGSVVGLVLVFFVSSNLLLSYQTAMETEEQIASMHSFLKEWTEKTTVLNNAEYRPVQVMQVDSVQTNLLLALQANQLELVGFKAVPSPKKDDNYHAFEMEFTGPYEVTVHFLENFHAKDALISIHYLKMEPNKGKIKTTIQYRVYIK